MVPPRGSVRPSMLGGTRDRRRTQTDHRAVGRPIWAITASLHGSPDRFPPNPEAMSTIGRSQVVPVAVGGLVRVVQTEGVALSAGLDDM